jgi:hypothetical protein
LATEHPLQGAALRLRSGQVLRGRASVSPSALTPPALTGSRQIEIVPAARAHADAIELRPGDARELAALGIADVPAKLSEGIERSIWSQAYLIDGEVAALVGLAAASLLGSSEGIPWLITGKPVDRHKKLFLRETRAGVERMKAAYPVLRNIVHAEYHQTIRWLRWLGFEVFDPQPTGSLQQPFCVFQWSAAHV